MGIETVRRQSLVNFFLQIVFTIIGFLSTIYFAHAVGASALGAYFLFLAYYGIIGLAMDGGFGGAAIKRISEGEESDAYFSAFFVMRSLSLTLVVIALLVFRGYFVDLNSSGAFIWLILGLIASLFLGGVHVGVEGCGKVGIHATCGFINNLSRIIIQVVAIFFGFGVAGMSGGFVAGMLIAAIIELRFFDLHFVRYSWRHIRSLSTFSFWLFLTSGGILVFSYADTIMIGYFLSNEDIGVYRVVLQFTYLATFTTIALQSTLWPKVSRWNKTGNFALIESSLSYACNYSLLFAIPVLAGGILLGDKLLYFFYGEEFKFGYKTLIILLIVQVINIFQFFFTTYLGAMDHQKDAFKVTIVAVMLNILLNLLLIPVVGIIGAAIATFVTMLINAILARNILSRIINVRMDYDNTVNILKASVLMSFFVGAYRLFVPLSNVWLVLIPIILGGMLYFYLVLKLDKKIYDELKKIFIHMNVSWPNWL